jgi:hypothetical protein
MGFFKRLFGKDSASPASPSPVRKQVYELTKEDIAKFAVWESCHGYPEEEARPEYQDEATVRPYEGHLPLDVSIGDFYVRTVFTLADGSRMPGLLVPNTKSIYTLVPAVITDNDGQMDFALAGIPDTAAFLVEMYRWLGGRQRDQVFPVTYETDVELVSGPLRGTLEGFHIKDESGQKKIIK